MKGLVGSIIVAVLTIALFSALKRTGYDPSRSGADPGPYYDENDVDRHDDRQPDI